MAARLMECVPNYSEGRRPEVIEAIVEPFRNAKGCILLDYRADPDHNRLVVSLAGQDGPLQEALLASARRAIELIDLNVHEGAHPRMGAVDVIPFVPLRGVSLEECVAVAHAFGERYQSELGVPVYYYEDAALRPERKRLEVVRKGQFEALRTEIANPERQPDVGPPTLHPTAGATAIGARSFLIAFNVNLNTADVEVAKRIASAIRSSSGGLAHVKAMGLALEERGLTQVSINVIDYEKNPLYRVVELVRMEARRWGVGIVECEVYGLAPAAALIESAAYYLQLNGFEPSQVVELALLERMTEE